MYGNTPFGDDGPNLTPSERKHLRSELSSVAAMTRELLPSEFVVGSELDADETGPRARVAVQPPAVTATCTLEGTSIDEHEDIATGLAASAVLQAKQATPGSRTPSAR